MPQREQKEVNASWHATDINTENNPYLKSIVSAIYDRDEFLYIQLYQNYFFKCIFSDHSQIINSLKRLNL